MGTIQAKLLEWVAMPSSRGSSQPRDQTQVSRIAGGFFYCLSQQGGPALGLSYSMWDLVPRPGIEPRPPPLGAQSLSNWTTWEVPRCLLHQNQLQDLPTKQKSYLQAERLCGWMNACCEGLQSGFWPWIQGGEFSGYCEHLLSLCF